LGLGVAAADSDADGITGIFPVTPFKCESNSPD
jgi:hypothetical protein